MPTSAETRPREQRSEGLMFNEQKALKSLLFSTYPLKKSVGPFLTIACFYTDQGAHKQSEEASDLFFMECYVLGVYNKILLFEYHEAFLNIMIMCKKCETGSE